MFRLFFENVSPIQLYIFSTFLIAIFFYSVKNENAVFLFPILFSSLVAEIISLLMTLQQKQIGLVITISTFIHNCLWLIILIRSVSKQKVYKVMFIFFVVFAVINFIFFEKMLTFNTQTFIIGAFTYLVIFIYESFYKLKREEFSFFLSNQFVLLSAPILFFIGLSAALGFKDRELINVVLFRNIVLYQFIAYFVNIIYYTLIIVYIYREKKLKDAE